MTFREQLDKDEKYLYINLIFKSESLAVNIMMGPVYEFENRQEQYIEQKGLVHGCPYPPYTPYSKE